MEVADTGESSCLGNALSTSTVRPKSIAGVDSIRFIAAAWVALGHGARFPLQQILDQKAGIIEKTIIGISNMMFNGVDAVIIFFIISGLCIHFPNVGKREINSTNFVVRRTVRISIPLLSVVAISRLMGMEYRVAVEAVLWTVYCELAYYVLYPTLFRISKAYSWKKIFICSLSVTTVLLWCYHKAINLWEMGVFTWVFCLPFWLLGVFLAERLPRITVSPFRLWCWRGGAILHGLFASLLIFHSPIVIGLVWTVPPFAVYSYFWILRELENLRGRTSKILEILGGASFSIYLTHKIALTFMEHNLLTINPVLRWVLLLGVGALLTLLFYALIERPSHNLARRIGARHALKTV